MSGQQLSNKKRQALSCTIRADSTPRHLAGWLLDGKIRQLSSGTLANRKLIVEKLIWFLKQNEQEECGSTQLKQFFAYISMGHEVEGGRWGNEANQKQVRPSTVQLYYRALHTFFLYLEAEEIVEASPFASLKPPIVREDQIQPFTASQVSALLHATTQSACPKRNRAIVLMLLDTGLRASELCGLTMRDIDFSGQKATVIGKGNKRRTVPFGRNVSRALAAYLKEDPHEDKEPLFFSWDETSSRSPMTRSGLLQLIRRLGRSAKIEATRCSPHTFRHTFAIEFLRNGGNQFTLMQILGHTQMRQTARYVALAQADIENQHRQYSPADRIKLRG